MFVTRVGNAGGGSQVRRDLKHSDSLTWYDELRSWDPMNFLMSQKGGSMATTRYRSWAQDLFRSE